MKRSKRMTAMSLSLLLSLLFIAPGAASEFPPGDFILEGLNQGELDSTRVAPVYHAGANGQLGDSLRPQYAAG